ncbi:8697_t:CDS:2, partial [Scutellospora calospora]
MQVHAENSKKDEKLYSDIALFFHNKHGGTIIGIVWIPINFTPKPWKASAEINSILILKIENPNGEKGEQISCFYCEDVLTTALEFERLGEGLVTGIE